jgi:TonB family protein
MMHDTFIYLLKVSAGLAIIFLPYSFLFRNDPNLALKRFYLLAGIIASWVFPFITFRKLPLSVDLTPTVFIDLETPALQAPMLESTGSTTAFTINWLQVLIFIYLAGLTFLFLKNLFLISKWNLSWRRNRNEEGVAFIKNDQVFTLFTRIFVPGSLQGEQDLDNVLLHEKAHIQQFHFIDLMLMELTLLLTWFNPFTWLISRMIKENHEHLADRQVLSAGVDPARYRAQLMNHTLGVNVFRLSNQFNHSLTLKRFKMMKKPKKSPLGIIKIALLIPAVLLTLGLTTGMTPQQKTVKGRVIFADTGAPATGASIVIRHGTVGTVVDRDGSFMLNVDGNPELAISFVGYSTLTVTASDIGKKPLKLEVTSYEMDLESVAMEVKKDDSEADPVFVANGKVVESIDDIDPENIESISVIKDPDDPMMKKYNAKNGVILIKTKDEKLILSPKESKELGEKHAGNETEEEVFFIVEDMPKFPGGLPALKTYIYSNLEYPEKAKTEGIQGEAVVRFLINEKGEAVKGEILRSSYQGFDAPALQVISEMPDWKPGSQRGKPVKVWNVISIKFADNKE